MEDKLRQSAAIQNNSRATSLPTAPVLREKKPPSAPIAVTEKTKNTK
jgi:hypothetical protein